MRGIHLLPAVRRRTSSKKFIRKITWFCAKPKFASRFSDHTCGLSGANESPFTVYAETMIWLSTVASAAMMSPSSPQVPPVKLVQRLL